MISVRISEQTADVVTVDGDLPGEISGAGVDVPTGPGGLQLPGTGLSEETVESLPLHDDVLHPSPLLLLHLGPTSHHPGSVEDAEETLPYSGALRPERFNKTVPHQS